MNKVCLWCKKNFITTRNNKIFCCKQCKIYNVRKNVVLRNQVIVEKECVRCYKVFSANNKTHKYCSQECRYPKKTDIPAEQSKNCIWCSQNIKNDTGNYTPFCSSRCRESATFKDHNYLDQCDQCKREYQKTKSNRKFCSKYCSKISRQNLSTKTLTDKKQELLQTDKCSKCHDSFPSQCLVFHHLYDKKFNLSKTNYPRFSDKEISEEVAKTQILCHNCHAETHYYERLEIKHLNIKRDSLYKERIRHNRKKTLINLLGSSCICCGLKSDIMDIFTFDHVGQKRFNLSKSELGSRKWSDILEESQNCELLCQNCHQLKNILPINLRRHPINTLIDTNLKLII
jgi:endogenous inhibitor of DNA gyrase (YacG/DUF329 family)